MKNDNLTPMTVRVDGIIKKRLENLAKERDYKFQEIINMALYEFCLKDKKGELSVKELTKTYINFKKHEIEVLERIYFE